MASVLNFINRNRLSMYPPQVHKSKDALKFGILGAAKIGPNALINPAKSHPDVIIQAVAARDKTKADAYAKKYGIPQVYVGYDALLDDASIDAIYIALPCGLHLEWAYKAIMKGKHVLLEKPATVNAEEARVLFRSPVLKQPNPPVLVEAMHFRFQPAWQYFLTLIDRSNLREVSAIARLPSYIIPQGGIRFDYDLGGGNMLDLGTYPMYALRQVIGAEPEECIACKVRTPHGTHQLCDEYAEAIFGFPGGIVGNAVMDMRAPVTTFPTFNLTVSHSEVDIDDKPTAVGHTKTRTRRLTFNNFLMTSFWHRIDIEDEFASRGADGKELKRWTSKQSKKVYTFGDAGIDQPGESFWSSYRHQLEQFVDRIRGNEGSGLWISSEDSLAQARMIDMAYEKSSLPLRPTSSFSPEHYS